MSIKHFGDYTFLQKIFVLRIHPHSKKVHKTLLIFSLYLLNLDFNDEIHAPR